LKSHSLISTLKTLRGNARGCVFTEPLWGIPYNLYIPYVSIYMLTLGLNDKQIGLIASISWGFQVVMSLFSGVITDKLGRRRTTLLFDLISWVVPSLLSAIAMNFWFFLIAGIINSVWRVTHNSWTCLLVEDADHEQLVDIYAWIYIAGLLVAFFSPLAGLLINKYDLVPTMRGLYFFAAFMFAFKATLTYFLTVETEQGKVRMQETKHQSVFAVLVEYKDVLRDLLRTPQTLYTAALMLILSAAGVVSGNFWAILVTEKLHVPAQNLAIFQFVRSITMLTFFFFITPRIRLWNFRLPMIGGFIGLIISILVLIAAPAESYAAIILSVILEACCYAFVSPQIDRLTVLTVNAQERARIQSILYVGVILLTSPFGWLAGVLSTENKILPFVLNSCLFAIGAVLAYFAGRYAERHKAAPELVEGQA